MENRGQIILVSIVGLIIAVAISVQVFTSGVNALSETFIWFGLLAVLVAVLRPVAGFYILLFACAYLDFAKRLMLPFGPVNFLDLVKVLGLAPAIMAGITLGVFSQRFRRGEILRHGDAWLIPLALAILAAILLRTFLSTGGSIMGTLSNGGANAVYIAMIVVARDLFPTPQDRRNVLIYSLFLFLPVAIYGVKQGITGLNALEIEYLLSGLTRTATMLDEDFIRPFSTLASNHPFSVMMGIVAIISSWLMLSQPGRWWLWLPLTSTFIYALVMSLGRTAWGLYLTAMIGLFAFRSGTRTITFYVLSALTFAFMLLFIDQLMVGLLQLEQALPRNSAVSEQAFRFGTFGTRVHSFKAWFSGGNLTLFGSRWEDREDLAHDMVGQLLADYGIVGVVIAFFVGSVALFLAHRSALRSSPSTRGETILYLAIVFAVLFSGFISGSHLAVFPINAYFWSFVGLLVACTLPAQPTIPGRSAAHTPIAHARLQGARP